MLFHLKKNTICLTKGGSSTKNPYLSTHSKGWKKVNKADIALAYNSHRSKLGGERILKVDKEF